MSKEWECQSYGDHCKAHGIESACVSQVDGRVVRPVACLLFTCRCEWEESDVLTRRKRLEERLSWTEGRY